MQEVFEKIIERLERLKTPCELGMIENGRYVLRDNTIEIVKQEAEQYNNGWIPCSKQMPEEIGWYLVSREDGTVNTSFCFEEKNWREGHNSKIIAWQPLPKPYQPKGE